MAIFRGIGGAGDSTTDATVTEVTQQAVNAANSASAAASSASSAATSATNAANSATASANSATASASSATDAETAQTAAETAQGLAEDAQAAAETAQGLAETAFDNFDDIYLGAKASDPTVDNDGDALQDGALFYSTTDLALKVWNGSAWVEISATGALLQSNNLSDLGDVATARTNLGLGTAATTASTDYATAAQGTLADSATQPGDNISTLTNDSGYLTSYTETDPIVGAVSGIVKADGVGNISAAVDGTDYISGNETITLSGDITGSGTTAITTSIAANSVGITEIDVTDGTNGQVLTTNGSGVLSFADASTVAALNDLTDVDTTGVTNGQVISYNSTSGNWEAADQASSGATFTVYKFTATSGQTAFTGTDDDGNTLSVPTNAAIVTLNGVVLEPTADYTTTSTTVTLNTGATTNDELNVIAFSSFSVADVVPASTGGTFSGNIVADNFTNSGVFYENAQTVTSNYTITTNRNAMSAGPITINTGVTVTVPSGSTWTVV